MKKSQRTQTPYSYFGIILISFFLTAASTFVKAEESLSGDAMVAKFVVKQSAESEITLFKMTVFKPGTGSKEYRLLSVCQNNPDAGRNYILGRIKPEVVQNVTLFVNDNWTDGEIEECTSNGNDF